MSVVARCPAKVNLALRVLGRRADGFHELDTIFQAVDLWDVLEARADNGLSLECEDRGIPTDERNLVIRAAGRLRERAGIAAGAAFRLRKGIPVGGGMGGGSSDAAGALLACARLWGLEPDRETMRALAAELGSDVAFFLEGGTARGTGRGERIEAMPFVGEIRLLLGMPPFGIPTGEVYERFAGRRSAALEDPAVRLTPPVNDVSLARLSTHKLPEGNDFGFVVNDLEAIVLEGWPELETFRDALRATGATRALVSGSGSTVFGIFVDSEAMERAAPDLERRFPEWSLQACRAIRGGIRVADGP